MSKFFQATGDDSSSGLSSSDEESLYGSSGSDSENLSGSGESDASASDADSDSEAESGNDSDDDSDGEGKPQNQFLRNKFLKGQDDSDSDSGDEKVTVKSAKDKILDEVVSNATSLENYQSNEDWVSALSGLDKLIKVQDRALKLHGVVPAEFLRSITALDSSLSQKSTKKLSPSMTKAQNTLRQRVKKTVREYSDRVASYQADPENYVASTPTVIDTKSKEKQPTTALGTATSTKATIASNAGDDTELSAATVFRTLLSVVESRGRKNTDRSEQLSLLEQQLKVAGTAYQKINVLLMLIPLRFDLNSASTQSSHSYSSLYTGADFSSWEQTEADIRQLFEILESQSEYVVVESATEPEDLEAGPEPHACGKRLIPGSLTTLVERLDDEHARILASHDPHTTEYIERLRDETRLADLILRAQCHQEQTLTILGVDVIESETYCRLLSRRVDHIYYKPAVAVAATEAAAWKRVPENLNSSVGSRVTNPEDVNAVALISDICSVLYRQANASLRAKAMLSLIYQHALSDDYYKARDLMLMSHLQSQIHGAEPSTQVLFNRALVQVGLCAFRTGLINDSLQSLQEICGSSRLKELLGQGQARQHNQDASSNSQSSTLELLPYHMHINLELVECVYLTVSMLTEVPYLANIAGTRSAQLDLKRRAMNRPFRRLLDVHDRQVFNGPSETTRDFVIQAAKRLQAGDWKCAFKLLSEIKVWSLLSLVTDSRTKVMAMLEHKLKIEGMRTYLLTYGAQAYSSLSLGFLEEEFSLNEKDVKQCLVKMIANDEVPALLDSTSKYLAFKPEADVSRLQALSLALADKAASLAERNERLAADGHIPEQNVKRPIRARA